MLVPKKHKGDTSSTLKPHRAGSQVSEEEAWVDTGASEGVQ